MSNGSNEVMVEDVVDGPGVYVVTIPENGYRVVGSSDTSIRASLLEMNEYRESEGLGPLIIQGYFSTEADEAIIIALAIKEAWTAEHKQ